MKMANATPSADEESRSSSSASDDGEIFEDALDFEDHDAQAVDSGLGTDEEDDDRPAVEHHKPSEKRQQQTAHFHSWYA
jgi:hypothetical protein